MFAQHPRSFQSEQSFVYFMMGLLRGRALVWAEALGLNQGLDSLTFEAFSAQLCSVSDHPDHSDSASARLLKFCVPWLIIQ